MSQRANAKSRFTLEGLSKVLRVSPLVLFSKDRTHGSRRFDGVFKLCHNLKTPLQPTRLVGMKTSIMIDALSEKE